MTLSPEDHAAMLRQAAEIMVDRLFARMDPDELIRLPVPLACQLSGKRQKELARTCHIIREGHREHYITLAEYKARLLPKPTPNAPCPSD